MFTGQVTIEQKQEMRLRGDNPFNSDDSVRHNPLCAWCLSEQGIPAGEESHGICNKHANRLLLQQRKLHSRRILASRSTSTYVANTDSRARASQPSQLCAFGSASTHTVLNSNANLTANGSFVK
jgi:hypothetical protein